MGHDYHGRSTGNYEERLSPNHSKDHPQMGSVPILLHVTWSTEKLRLMLGMKFTSS